MNTTKRFDLAMSGLVGAFFSNTLAKGLCTACAVGNITAKANGIKIISINSDGSFVGTGVAELAAKGASMGLSHLKNSAWNSLFFTTENGQTCNFDDTNVSKSQREAMNHGFVLIAPTGYSAAELAQIELAFETASKISHPDYDKHTEDEIKEDQYNGLVAVVDIMCRLDGMTESDAQFFRSAFDYEKPPVFEPANAELVEQILVEA